MRNPEPVEAGERIIRPRTSDKIGGVDALKLCVGERARVSPAEQVECYNPTSPKLRQ